MTAAPIEFELRIKGEEVVESALDSIKEKMGSVDGAQTAVKRSTDSLAQSQRTLGTITKDAGQGFQRLGSVLNQSGAALGSVGGAAASTAGKITTLAGSMTAAAASGGPIGILVVAIGSITSALSYMTDEIAKAQKGLDDFADDAQRRATDIAGNIARVQSAQSARALESRLAQGQGTSQELTGYKETLQARQQRIDAQVAELEFSIGRHRSGLEDLFTSTEEIERQASIAGTRIAQLREDRARIGEQIALNDNAILAAHKNERTEADKAARAAAAHVDALKNLATSTHSVARSIDGLDRLMNEAIANSAYLRGLGESLAPPEEQAKGAVGGLTEKQFTAQLTAGIEGKGGESDKDRMIKDQDEIRQEIEKTGATIGDVFGTAFQAAINGQKAFGKAIRDGFKDMLASLAKSETVKGFATLADALAASAIPGGQASAAALYASSAQHFGAAALAGAGALAVGAIGGGGGGGGGGGSRARPSAGAYTGGGGGGEGRSVTINMNAPVVTAGTYADVGRTLKQVLQDGENKYG